MDRNDIDIFTPMREFFSEEKKSLYTAIPAFVTAFDPKYQTAQLQIAIKQIDYLGNQVDCPIILECPVLQTGGNWLLETQIDAGTEGLAVFSQRCIDAWLQTGGVAQNPIMRVCDIQDAFFIAGFRSNPKAIPSFANNGIRIRNRQGSHYVWLKKDGTIEAKNDNGSIVIESGGTVKINGKVTIDTAGNVTTPADMKASGISLNSHVHGGISRGGSSTNSPS